MVPDWLALLAFVAGTGFGVFAAHCAEIWPLRKECLELRACGRKYAREAAAEIDKRRKAAVKVREALKLLEAACPTADSAK